VIKMAEIIKRLDTLIEEVRALREALRPHEEYIRVEETKTLKKLPKSAKKIEAGATYRIAKTRCNKCDGRISWDGYDKDNPTPPIHVKKDGTIKGNGQCPEWEE